MSETVQVQGYEELRARLARISGPQFGRSLMGQLGAAAVREQKLLLYQKVHRKTGHSGQLVALGNVSDTSAQTIARGTAVYADRGTKAHDIYPRLKRALFFSASGAGTRLTGSVRKKFRGSGGLAAATEAGVDLVFAMHVRHPGTKAHPFMVAGAQKAIANAGLAKKVVAAWDGRTVA